jgi:hypothetical protein
MADQLITGTTLIEDKRAERGTVWSFAAAASDGAFSIVEVGVAEQFRILTGGNVEIKNGTLDMNSHKITSLTTPTNDYDAATKEYVDDGLGVGVTVSSATFDITSNTSVISGTADKKTYIVAISIHNNDTTSTNDTHVKITDGNAGTVLVGGATGNIYLVGRGGFFGLPMSVAHPWFNTSTNTALYINPTDGKRVAGTVWYYQE